MTEISGAENNAAKAATLIIQKHGKNSGITYELLNHVKSLGLRLSNGSVSKDEWEKTLKVLEEINSSRISQNKTSIFGKNFAVTNGQKIDFSADEMSQIYQAMGVEIKSNNNQSSTTTQIKSNSQKQDNSKAIKANIEQKSTIKPNPQKHTLTTFSLQNSVEIKSDNSVLKADAIPDTKNDAKIAANNTIKKVQPKTIKEGDWRATYQSYIPANKTKYDRVYNRIKNNKDLLNKSDTKYLANMVCKISNQYGIDPEIVESILANESHYVFEPWTMNPKKKKYKGVMQVGPSIIRSIYADTKDANNKKLTARERREAFDHIHYVSDQKRIDELKKKYPTPEKLYEAIKTDVALGLEVGIMAYKGSLSMNKGSTTAALAQYCGSQYHFPSGALTASVDPIPRKIYPIPQYSRA